MTAPAHGEPWILVLAPGLDDPAGLAQILADKYTVVITRNLASFAPPNPAPPSILFASFDPGGARVSTVLRALSDRGWNPPIVAVTREARTDLLLAWLEEGICGYLTVPYDPEKVRGAVAAVVRRPTEQVDTKGIQAQQPAQGWVELSAPSHAEYLDRFQRFFATIHESRLPPEVARQILMAVYELGHNAIEWGNRRDLNRRVTIAYCLFEDKLIFKIQDEGEGFDVRKELEMPADPLEVARRRRQMGKRPGGLGLVMVRRLMDQVIFNEKGNIVIFEKQIPPAAG